MGKFFSMCSKPESVEYHMYIRGESARFNPGTKQDHMTTALSATAFEAVDGCAHN